MIAQSLLTWYYVSAGASRIEGNRDANHLPNYSSVALAILLHTAASVIKAENGSRPYFPNRFWPRHYNSMFRRATRVKWRLARAGEKNVHVRAHSPEQQFPVLAGPVWGIIYSMKSLVETNAYLRGPAARRRMLRHNALESSIFEGAACLRGEKAAKTAKAEVLVVQSKARRPLARAAEKKAVKGS